jgi:hypothetical protein
MSEANTSPPPPPVAPAAAASLYPADGGAAAADALAAGQATTAGTDSGTSTVAGTAGQDTVAGNVGQDTVTGGTETAPAGTDTLNGGNGADSISVASYDFKLPEGFIGDDALTATAKDTFAAAGVAPDKAQGLIDLFGKAMKASADAQVTAHNTQQTTWINEINAMPEFTGPTRETSLASIGRLYDEFGTPEAKAALNAYGVGNNPALVKMMLKIASTVSEGGPTGQGRPTGKGGQQAGPKTVGGSLYPDGGAGPAKN